MSTELFTTVRGKKRDSEFHASILASKKGERAADLAAEEQRQVILKRMRKKKSRT